MKFFSTIAAIVGANFAAAQTMADASDVPTDTIDLRDLKQTTFQASEKLLFDIIWGGWDFTWIKAGQASMELLPTSNSKVWQIRSQTWCNGFFQGFYPVHDTVSSFINARGIYPLKFRKTVNEGSYHTRVLAEYDQQKHVLRTLDTTFNIEPFSHDILSAFYYIRTQSLVVGKSFEIAAASGKKKYALRVLCLREETVEVPAGKFPCLVVEPMLKGDGLFKSKGKLWIWVTRDSRHLPVKMQSKIPVGSIKAELVRIGNS